MSDGERWLPVVGYEGLYEVSDRGAVHSIGSSRQLRRRRAASWRSPRLESGSADPWHYDPPTAGYEAAAAHLLGCGLLPAPNREGLRLMWHRGSHSRQAAELIAERWELTR